VKVELQQAFPIMVTGLRGWGKVEFQQAFPIMDTGLRGEEGKNVNPNIFFYSKY
jgi:hypothetical protein